MMAKVKAKLVELCVITVCLPLANCRDEAEEIYEQIDDLMKLVKKKIISS